MDFTQPVLDALKVIGISSLGAFGTMVFSALASWRERVKGNMYKDIEMRKNFIDNVIYTQIRELIDDDDKEFGRFLEKINPRTTPVDLSDDDNELWRRLVIYLQFFESVALLLEKGLINRKYANIWYYYLGLIRSNERLFEYVSFRPYGWDLLVKHCYIARARLDNEERKTHPFQLYACQANIQSHKILLKYFSHIPFVWWFIKYRSQKQDAGT